MPESRGDVSITDHLPDGVDVVTEGERLRFAKQLLLSVGVVCVLIFAAYALYPANQALSGIFELIKIGLLPLVTLVVSFYFP